MKFAIGSDHGGYALKQVLAAALAERGYDVHDFGTTGDASVDYPDYGAQVAKAVSNGEAAKGVLICGTGIGMSIIANKYPGVRAALVTDTFMARMAAEHNDANILVLGGRLSEPAAAREMLNAWLDAKFEGGRHEKRLSKIRDYEKTVR